MPTVVRLPYPPRAGQDALIQQVQAAQAGARHLVVEAATGTGKTVAVLAAALATCRRDGRRVIWTTRTNSQQAQVVREHAMLRSDAQQKGEPGPGLLIPFTGRAHACPLLKDDPQFAGATGKELGRLCRRAKQAARVEVETGRPQEGACPYFRKLLEDGPGPVQALLEAGGAEGRPIAAAVAAAGSCPYEALKQLLPRASVIVLPYTFLLEDSLRNALTQWMGSGLDECHLVVDEAHNLPEAARLHHSPSLGLETVRRAVREAEGVKDPVLAGEVLTTTFLETLTRVVYQLVDEHVEGRDDALLPPDALQEALMVALRLPSPRIIRIAQELESWGEIIREERAAQGRLPRSYLGAVGSFLAFWMRDADHGYARLALGGERPAVEACLLDPAQVLGWLAELASTVHMSGTLAPPEDHVNLCGLTGATTCIIPSPFDARQLHVYGIEGVHRRWQAHQDDPTHADRLQRTARAILDRLPGRTALFFPSHRMLRDYLEEGFLHGVARGVHAEHPDMDSPSLTALVSAFTHDPDPNALLLGVLGGRLTEGIDYPGDAMANVLILGVPYPRPTARIQALIHREDAKHGSGWQTVVHNPTARILRQTIGRLIRGPDDCGVAVVLDERVVRFRTQLPPLAMVSAADDVWPHAEATARGLWRAGEGAWFRTLEAAAIAPSTPSSSASNGPFRSNNQANGNTSH